MAHKPSTCADCGKPTEYKGRKCRNCAHRIEGRTYYLACVDCGKPKPRIRSDTGPRCKACAGVERKDDGAWVHWLHWVRRAQVVEWLGGICVDCGYKDNLAALEFDHVAPRTYKQYTMGSLLGQGRPRVLAELPKVELVCSNCHSIRTDIRRRT